jgi:hypothetical protein
VNLPEWDECNDREQAGVRMNPVEQFVYDHEPTNSIEWRDQLQEVLDYLSAPRSKKDGGSGAPRSTKKLSIRLDPPTPPIVGPQIIPPLGKTWKGTGRFYMDGDERKELGSWSNPAGDVEAARLTKETGTMHLVDPRSGDVISMGGEHISSLATAAEMPIASPALTMIGGEATTEGFMPAAK